MLSIVHLFYLYIYFRISHLGNFVRLFHRLMLNMLRKNPSVPSCLITSVANPAEILAI